MKRIITGAVVAALAALGALVLPATAAQAAGSDGPTPYTVTATGVQLPEGDVFPAHGHINWRTTLGNGGMHFDPNNGHPGGAFIGQSFFPITLQPGECITWVQISHYNEHFGEGGQTPVCAPKPEPPFEGVEKYTPSYTATCESATFSHPAIKTGIGIANVYGVRYGATQAEAQAKAFEPYTPGAVVTMPFADPYIGNGYYFELKVGYDGQSLTHQIGQTRGTSKACDRPIPEQPQPLTGSEERTLDPICVVPADGTATLATESRTWTQGHVWNAETWAWDLVAEREYGEWAETSSQVVPNEECEAETPVPPAPPAPKAPEQKLPTAPLLAETGAPGSTSPATGYLGLGLVALGLALGVARYARRRA